jgi:hypothetical protein
MAASFDPFYYDGTSFETSTALFTDAGLTLEAPAGTYRLGGVFRIWSGSPLTLSQVYPCGSCCQPTCGYTAPFTGSFDITTADNNKDKICADAGTGFGAIVIDFDFAPTAFTGFPMGFDATYASSTYTSVSSNRYGYIGTRYKGADAPIPEVDLIAGSPYTLLNREWQPITASFQSISINSAETVTALNTTLTANNPEKCYMVIPKPNAFPRTLDIEVYSPRPNIWGQDSRLDVTVNCPSGLASFNASIDEAIVSPIDACGLLLRQTLYHAQVNGTAGVPRLFDIVYNNIAYTTHPTVGYYHVDGGRWIYIGNNNGIVDGSGVCLHGGTVLTEVICSPNGASSEFGACYETPSALYYHDGAWGSPAMGDTLYSDSAGATTLAGGYYQLQEEYKIINLTSLGVVNYISTCS